MESSDCKACGCCHCQNDVINNSDKTWNEIIEHITKVYDCWKSGGYESEAHGLAVALKIINEHLTKSKEVKGYGK